MTLLDLLILAIVVAAGIAGFRALGGSARAGGLLGVLVGAGFAVTAGLRLAEYGGDRTTRLVLLIGGVILVVLLGAAVGGWIGGLLTGVLLRGRLTVLDRALGALAGAASALLVLWALAVIVPSVIGPGSLEPLTLVLEPLGRHSTVLRAVDTALPATSADLNALLHITDTAARPR